MTEAPILPEAAFPPGLIPDIVGTARARNILKGSEAAILARLEQLAENLFSRDTGFFHALFKKPRLAEALPKSISPEYRDLGERFWRTAFTDMENRRMDGSFYTPVPVIDRILDATCRELLRSGPAPFTICDPAIGCGFFPLRLIERLLEKSARRRRHIREWADSCLFGVDIDPAAVFVTRVGLWLALSDGKDEFIPNPNHFRAGDSLLGSPFGSQCGEGDAGLDWGKAFPEIAAAEGFDCIVGNPPYEVLTNFSRHPRRRVLAESIRNSNYYRDSLVGQINLYRCFIERSLDLLKPGGKLSFIVPFSLTRDTSALPLRRRLVEECAASKWFLFSEHDQVFPGVTQSACIFVATKNGGPVKKILLQTDEETQYVHLATLKKFTGDALIIRSFSKNEETLLMRIWKNCPNTFADAADMRVGEVDQTFFRDCMADDDTGTLLARGAHLSPFRLDLSRNSTKERFLRLDRFLEKKGAAAENCRERASAWRVAQLGIRNMHTLPRLVAGLIPPGVYPGNSLNIYTPRVDMPLEYLAGILNSRLLDWLFRLASGNNNINLHEMRRLPFPLAPRAEDMSAVAEAYRACADAAESGEDLAGCVATLNEAVERCYGVEADFCLANDESI